MASPDHKHPLEPPAATAEENIYSFWTQEDHSDKRGLRFSISAAVVVHALLLTVTFPRLFSEELDREVKDRKLFVVETPRFKKPPPPPAENLPEFIAKKVPIPDPEPDKPEPYVADLEPPPKLDIDVDDLVFNVPDPPPVPETKNLYIAGAGEVDPPERLHYVKPLYTEIARRTGTKGLVIVKAIINTEGEVIDLEVLKSVGMGLTEEALKAVSQWRYRPSTVDGRPVNVVLTVSVNFQLQ